LQGGGYASRFDLAHRPTGQTRDLYDQDFVLLALAAAAAVLPVAPLRRQALDLLTYIDSAFAHPKGGYQESVPPRPPRRQNPHMHALEALLAAHGAFGDAEFLDCARAVVALFMDRLLDPDTGALPEFFDEGLNPLREGGSFVVEPGHHCEWVWLLEWYQRVAGPDARLQAAMAGLMLHVDRHGLHPASGDVIDEVRGDGSAPLLTSRLWPQTERLKAAFLRPDSTASHRQAALAGLAAWLRPDGLWVERRDAAGDALDGPVPASSLYHLTAAILAVCPAG
jgi:mannose-6-phosphate isomerase